MSAGRDTLVLAGRDSVMHFAFASVARLEIARPRHRWPIVLGMSVGAIAGAALGISRAGTKCLRGPFIDPCDSTTELLAPVAGAVVGAFLGGGLGVLVQKRWARVGIVIRRE